MQACKEHAIPSNYFGWDSRVPSSSSNNQHFLDWQPRLFSRRFVQVIFSSNADTLRHEQSCVVLRKCTLVQVLPVPQFSIFHLSTGDGVQRSKNQDFFP